MIALRAARLEHLVTDIVNIVIKMLGVLTLRSSQQPKLYAPDPVGKNVLTNRDKVPIGIYIPV